MRASTAVRNRKAYRHWIVFLILLAVVMRALVPSGFMYAADGDSALGLKVVICTDDGLKEVVIDEA